MRDPKLTSEQMGRISADEYAKAPSSGIVIVLDNVRSAHNVGSAFRTADAFKTDMVYLCGICAVPPSAEIHKTALGAELSVPWESCGDTLSVVKRLKDEGYTVVAVEQTEKSVKLNAFRRREGVRYAFVFGNEVSGVAQEVVDSADFSLEIPQFGTKHSLNVSVSVGIILWQAVAGNIPESL